MDDVPVRDQLAALKSAADSGDRIAEEHLVEVLGEIAVIRIRGRLGSRVGPADLNDIAQEVRYRLFRGIGSCRADSRPRLIAWTWEIARNCISDHYRSRKPEGSVPAESLPDPRATDDTSGSLPPPLMRIVAEVEATLSSDKQRLLFLRLVEGLTWPEVGSVLGISRHAAKRRWQRLQAHLHKKVLERVGGLPETEKRAVLEELEARETGGREGGSSSE